jgi:HK97 family phage prohead protease
VKPPRLCYRAVEFRATEGDGRTLEGYAAVFDTPTRIDSWEGMFDEQIARGAFARTINARMPVLQFDHGRDARTGSVPIGAIQELREDDHGLYVRAGLFDNATVEPIRQAIAGGAIDGMSFRFRVAPNGDTWAKRAGDVQLRTIREAELFELGPVVFPAYEATTVGVRSLLAGLDGDERAALIRDLAAELREPAPSTSPEHTEPAVGTSGPSLRERRERLFPYLTRSNA